MIGTSDEIGRAAIEYLTQHGDRADSRIGDDVSRALGQQRLGDAHRLARVRLRLMRMERVGLLDGPNPPWRRCAAAVRLCPSAQAATTAR